MPDLPNDPANYISALALHRYFETVAFTREDSARAGYYAQNLQRQELASRATDLKSFLASLSMRMTVNAVNPADPDSGTSAAAYCVFSSPACATATSQDGYSATVDIT